MSKYVRLENNQVIECIDYLPQINPENWIEAIDVVPFIVPNRQILGSHYFDIDKRPIEIVWSLIDLTVEDRKNDIMSQLNSLSYNKVHDELIKEFTGNISDMLLVQSIISQYRIKRQEIENLSSHEEVDAYVLANP